MLEQDRIDGQILPGGRYSAPVGRSLLDNRPSERLATWPISKSPRWPMSYEEIRDRLQAEAMGRIAGRLGEREARTGPLV
jgi:hypothetical protein